ncbi:hypothetical protein FRC17_006355 [Serendipita sp. 399]|nr:hypothetical protein FRC17_006355 [Serendipita sp. 399]
MEDMWDEPATVLSTASRHQEPLFLPSDEESQPLPSERSRSKTTVTSGANKDSNSFIADLMDDLIDKNGAGSHTLEAQLSSRAKNALKEKERPRENGDNKNTPNDALREEEEGTNDKPKRRVIAKVDDERLLGERGFPALIKEAKKFKPKGKGHEAEDLDRLLSIYQFWAHNMFPKTQFRDTVERVERVNMSMWRDAERSTKEVTLNPNKSEDSDDSNGAGEREINVTAATLSTGAVPVASNRSSTPARQLTEHQEDAMWDEFDDALEVVEREAPPYSAQPRANPIPNDPDDDDLEEWFNSEPIAPKRPTNSRTEDTMDVDEQPSKLTAYPTADNWDHDLFA